VVVFSPNIVRNRQQVKLINQLNFGGRRWEDNIKMDLQEVGGVCGDWMERAQDRDKWRALVSTVMNFRFHKCGEFLD
jgi:hypothetical protein